MNIGMLWFDSTQEPLEKKVEKAAEYYTKKYGKRPTVCFVPKLGGHGTLPEAVAGGIQIKASREILPKHLWLGVEEI